MSADAAEEQNPTVFHPSWCDPEECWVGGDRPWHRSRMQFMQLKDALDTRLGVCLLKCTLAPEVTFVEFEAYIDDAEEPVMEFMLMSHDLWKLSGLLDSVSRALATDEAPPAPLGISQS